MATQQTHELFKNQCKAHALEAEAYEREDISVLNK